MLAGVGSALRSRSRLGRRCALRGDGTGSIWASCAKGSRGILGEGSASSRKMPSALRAVPPGVVGAWSPAQACRRGTQPVAALTPRRSLPRRGGAVTDGALTLRYRLPGCGALSGDGAGDVGDVGGAAVGKTRQLDEQPPRDFEGQRSLNEGRRLHSRLCAELPESVHHVLEAKAEEVPLPSLIHN
eukprot:NODE_14120_length_1127_cov_3.297000.p2 GENE.NODE_14120_length_1127_cov_3.297000~~NODE_14120_length_1127_cov_3.297000.p2  ORF type:complete len:186 (+),score=37.30 NODE_14120_length_1127_cov_3.297000:430-987(+)